FHRHVMHDRWSLGLVKTDQSPQIKKVTRGEQSSPLQRKGHKAKPGISYSRRIFGPVYLGGDDHVPTGFLEKLGQFEAVRQEIPVFTHHDQDFFPRRSHWQCTAS